MNTALTKNQPSFYLFAQIYKSNICHGNVFVSSTCDCAVLPWFVSPLLWQAVGQIPFAPHSALSLPKSGWYHLLGWQNIHSHLLFEMLAKKYGFGLPFIFYCYSHFQKQLQSREGCSRPTANLPFQGSIITHMVVIGVEGGALSKDLIGELPRCRDPIGR